MNGAPVARDPNGAYIGLLRPLFAPFGSRATGAPFMLAALAGLGALALIFAAHRRMREP